MENTVNQIPPDCQEIHYRYDFTTNLRHAYIDKNNHPVEAVKSAVPFEALDTFYWLENENDPDLRREDLVLDAEVIENGNVLMEVHPGLFRHPEMIDLESVWFVVRCKVLKQGDVFTLGEIEFIWVMAFLKDDCRAEIKEDKLFFRVRKPNIPAEPEDDKKKAVAAAPKKRAKVRRLNVAPADVVKEGKRLELWPCWLVIFKQLYRRSRFRKLRDVPHYPRETTREGRYYFCGNAYLSRITGLDEWTVRWVLHKLEEAKLIYIRYKGYKGRGCSIIELPVNIKLVWKWRREHKGLKLSTFLSGGSV